MKIINTLIVVLLGFLALTALSAQTTNNGEASVPDIKTFDDFTAYLCSTPWTWERPGHGKELIHFKPNGDVSNDTWGWTDRYDLIDLHKVVLRHQKFKEKDRMEIIFSDDYKSYSGQDFRHIKLKGKPHK